MTDEISSTISDAQYKCKKKSGRLPIIKSESENTFILGLMSEQKPWVWLGMQRKDSKMVWFDNTPAELSYGAPYSAWGKNEPSSQKHEICAYLNFKDGWNNNKCDYGPNTGPLVLCQKERQKDGSSKTEG